AAFFTAAAGTASIFPLDSACSGGGTGSSAVQAKPWKGKALMKYVVKYRPKVKGKVIGDKGASAKLVITGLMYSSTLYNIRIRFHASNLNSGGAAPIVGGSATSCTSPTTVSFGYTMVNITSNKVGRRKRYSFKYLGETDQSCKVADLRSQVALTVSRLGKYSKVFHAKNLNALCGKIRKVK
ncbi:unnamed protein product, partial [Closterium sp. Yama58-4]